MRVALAVEVLMTALNNQERAAGGSQDRLTARVRGEYREMPGLRLTLQQALRLWQLDAPTCERVLGQLMDEGFLRRTSDGAFVAFAPESPRRPVSALASL